MIEVQNGLFSMKPHTVSHAFECGVRIFLHLAQRSPLRDILAIQVQ
jgi:hypothetical protein